uniref:Nuclear shuttle protein n=1 Tax=Watermelon chlorotic stunt virus TaxID=35341 RepID=M9SY90_9GEMI|nr:BV1 [Watermelon chlorotic stunt virus]
MPVIRRYDGTPHCTRGRKRKQFFRPFKSGLFRRRQASRRLFAEKPRDKLSRRCLEDVHSGPSYALMNQCDVTSYVTYPILGLEGNGGRSSDFIKLMNVRVSGTINVTPLPAEPMSDRSPMNGIFVLLLIVDRKPFVPEGVNVLPSFKELFGEYECVYGIPRVKENQRHRYRILGMWKQYVSGDDSAVQKDFTLRRNLSGPRYNVWAAFKDIDQMSTGGNYKNVSKNAILACNIWVSTVRSKCEVYSQFVLDYVG